MSSDVPTMEEMQERFDLLQAELLLHLHLPTYVLEGFMTEEEWMRVRRLRFKALTNGNVVFSEEERALLAFAAREDLGRYRAIGDDIKRSLMYGQD